MEITLKKKIKAVLLVAFVGALLIRVFVVEGFIVKGDSMSPTVLSGDYVFVNKLAYWHSGPSRGDVVVVIPRNETFKVIKRIIVLPGERFSIENGKVVIREDRLDEGKTLDEDYVPNDIESPVGITQARLDPEEYFALGDNVSVSLDSRVLGYMDRWDIKGRAFGVFRLNGFKYIGL